MNPALSKKNNLGNERKGGMKVLVVTGQSGGHIFPALSFLDRLKQEYADTDTLLVLPKGALVSDIAYGSYKVRHISVSNIKLCIDLKFIFAILKFLKGSLEGLILFLEFRPDVVVGFGSIVCVPLIIFAWFFRARTLIHEQNLIPGRANRFLAKFSDKIAVSFQGSRGYFGVSSGKTVLTGNPIRKELKQTDKDKARDFFGLSPDKFTVLVMGGSLGSHRINGGFLSAVSGIKERSSFQVIHLCGSGDYAWLSDGYKNLGVNVRVFAFLSQMHYAYSACELAICRAGATTLAEMIFFQLPAIIIPYPFAYGHQVANAGILTDRGCAILIRDDELDGNKLKQNIEHLVDNPDEIRIMHSRYKGIAWPCADALLVNEVMSLG